MINTPLQHMMSDVAIPAAAWQTSAWVAQWGDWIELPCVSLGSHGIAHRQFHREGCR